MMIRKLMFASLVALAGCNPQTAPEADPASPGNELPAAADLLANAPLPGSWENVGDGATVGTMFTSTAYPDTLTIGCNSGSGEAFISWTVQSVAEDVEVRIYTASGVATFAATGFNDGVHIRSIDAPGSDPRLAGLKATQAKFALQGSGEAIVVPWDPSIAVALNDCAS